MQVDILKKFAKHLCDFMACHLLVNRKTFPNIKFFNAHVVTHRFVLFCEQICAQSIYQLEMANFPINND